MASYTKRDFQLAYRWMFAATLKRGAEVYKTANKDYIEAVVTAYRQNFANSFYND